MTTMETLSRIERRFRDILDQPTLHLEEDTALRTIPELDSVALVQVVMAIETEFGVKFELADVTGFKHVGDMVRAIRERIGV